MPPLPDNESSPVEHDHLGEVASAIREMADHVNTIKVFLVALVVVSILNIAVSIGTTIFTFSGAYLDMIQESIEEARETIEERDHSSSPSRGDPLPAISLPDSQGRTWSNSDWEGKVLLLNFWATWCAPCVEEMPLFDEALEKYGGNGFSVIAISVDREGWDVVMPFLEKHKLSYPVLLADESIRREFGGVNRLPTTYFVHKSGAIHSKHVGAMDRTHIMEEVEFLLREDGLLETPPGAS